MRSSQSNFHLSEIINNLNNNLIMATHAPQQYYEMNPASWGFGQAVKKDHGGIRVAITENTESKYSPVFQLPRLMTPFGIGVAPKVQAKADAEGRVLTRKSISLSVDDERFHAWLNSIDTVVAKHISSISADVLGRHMSPEIIAQAGIVRTLAWKKPGSEYAHRVKLGINTGGENLAQILVNQRGTNNFQLGCPEHVVKYSEVVTIVRAQCVWISLGQVSVTLLITNMQVFQAEPRSKMTFNMAQPMNIVDDAGPDIYTCADQDTTATSNGMDDSIDIASALDSTAPMTGTDEYSFES
jgi:hypothetical protein